MVFELLVVNALLELFVHHYICKPSEWRGEMGVAVQAQSEVPLVGVQVPRIHSELLDLYCLQQQQLFQSIINRLLLEQQLEFVL